MSNPATTRATGNDCGRGLVSCRRTGNVIHVDKHPGGRPAEEKSRGKPWPVPRSVDCPYYDLDMPFAVRREGAAFGSPLTNR